MDCGLLGAGECDDCPGTECPASTFERITHIKGLDAGLMFGFHNGVTAVGPAIDRAEPYSSQRRRRSLCLDLLRKAAGVESCQIVAVSETPWRPSLALISVGV